MSRNDHLIGRLQFEIEVANSTAADFVLQHTGELVKHHLIKHLEAILDQVQANDTFLRIDRLTLQLGELDPDNFRQQLIRAFVTQLRIQLPAALQQANSEATPAQKHQENELGFFLKHGHLPWWSIGKMKPTYLKTLFLGMSLEQLVNLFVAQRADPLVQRRILQQLPPPLQTPVSRRLLSQHARKLQYFIKDILAFNKQAPILDDAALRRYLQQILLQVALDNSKAPETTTPQLATAILATLAQQLEISKGALWQHLERSVSLHQGSAKSRLSSAMFSNPRQKAKLKQLLVPSPQSAEAETAIYYTPAADAYTSLRYFLRAGYLLLSEAIQSFELLSDWLLEQALANNRRLAAALQQYITEELSRRRLARQFLEPVFAAIVHLLAGASSAQLLAWQKETLALYRDVGAPKEAVDWHREALLVFLSKESQEPRLFFEHLLQLTPLPRQQQLQELLATSTHPSLTPLLMAFKGVLDANQSEDDEADELERVKDYLRMAKSDSQLPSAIHHIIQTLLDAHDPSFLDWLRQSIRKEQWHHRWTENLAEELLEKMLRALSGSANERMQFLRMDLALLHLQYQPLAIASKQLKATIYQTALEILVEQSDGFKVRTFWQNYLQKLAQNENKTTEALTQAYAQRTAQLQEEDQLFGPLFELLLPSRPTLTPSPQAKATDWTSPEQQLLYYLEHGRLSTAYPKFPLAQLSPLLVQTLQKKQAELLASLLRTRRAPNLAERLSQLAPPSALRPLIQALYTTTPSKLKGWLESLQNAIQPANVSELILLTEMLQYGLATHQPKLTDVALLRQALRNIAPKARLSYQGLLQQMGRQLAAANYTDEFQQPLVYLLRDLSPGDREALAQWLEQDATRAKSIAPLERHRLDLLHWWLQYGRWPWWAKSHTDSLAKTISYALTHHGPALLSLVRNYWPQPSSRRFWLAANDNKSLAQLLQVCLGPYASFALACYRLSTQILPPGFNRNPARLLQWSAILTPALKEGAFHSRTFVQAWLKALAKAYQVPESVLRTRLSQINTSSLDHRRILELVHELSSEVAPASPLLQQSTQALPIEAFQQAWEAQGPHENWIAKWPAERLKQQLQLLTGERALTLNLLREWGQIALNHYVSAVQRNLSWLALFQAVMASGRDTSWSTLIPHWLQALVNLSGRDLARLGARLLPHPLSVQIPPALLKTVQKLVQDKQRSLHYARQILRQLQSGKPEAATQFQTAWADPPQRQLLQSLLTRPTLQGLLRQMLPAHAELLLAAYDWSLQAWPGATPGASGVHASVLLDTLYQQEFHFFPTRFAPAWINELHLQLPDSVANIVTALSDTTLPSAQLGSWLPKEREKRSANWIPIQEQLKNDLGLLRYYLRYGSLPARQGHVSAAEISRQFIALLDDYPTLLTEALQGVLPQPGAARRIRLLLPSTRRNQLGQLWYGERWRQLQGIWKDLLQLLPPLLSNQAATQLPDIFFDHLLRTQKPATSAVFALSAYLANLLQQLIHTERLDIRTTLDTWERNLQTQGLRLARLQQLWPATAEHLRKDLRQKQEKKQQEANQADYQRLDHSLFVHNAGLVLVGAFLPRYFNMLGLLEANRFSNETAAIRATHLLQYLASGHTETSEDLLVFNKVLCGLPIATPVPASITLTEQEEEVSGQLLGSVLQNWTAMNNASLENLRGSFLIREGRLLEEDLRWTLAIDPATYDIALDSLPWTLSLLNLPWLDKHIEVDWGNKWVNK